MMKRNILIILGVIIFLGICNVVPTEVKVDRVIPIYFGGFISGLIVAALSWLGSAAAGSAEQKEKAEAVMNLLSEKYSDFMTPEDKAKLQAIRDRHFAGATKAGTEKEALAGFGAGSGLAQQRTFIPLKQARAEEATTRGIREEVAKRAFTADKERLLLEQLPGLSGKGRIEALAKFEKEFGTPKSSELNKQLKSSKLADVEIKKLEKASGKVF